MTGVNALFTIGLVSFLAGLWLVDYRLSMVIGGALLMLYATLVGRAIVARKAAVTDQEVRR